MLIFYKNRSNVLIRHLIKTRKGKDREEEKKEEQGIKMVTTIVDINLSISVVTLEANDLKVSINRFSE